MPARLARPIPEIIHRIALSPPHVSTIHQSLFLPRLRLTSFPSTPLQQCQGRTDNSPFFIFSQYHFADWYLSLFPLWVVVVEVRAGGGGLVLVSC
jgi:hypothetical protein